MSAPSCDTVAAVLHHADNLLVASRGRLFDLMRIPSISAEPDYREDCVRAAEWVYDQLTSLDRRLPIDPRAGTVPHPSAA